MMKTRTRLAEKYALGKKYTEWLETPEGKNVEHHKHHELHKNITRTSKEHGKNIKGTSKEHHVSIF